jgi:phosphopantothenoylcysteine decarboxylase/phosphopantothenate--cysteine ligase
MPPEIIIGVSGGIAAYKTAALVSSLVQHGHGVSVVMTKAARKFVGPATFRALTGRPVLVASFDPRFPLGAHIELAETAELMCVAPASANLLAKAACGLADDALATLLLSFTGPVLLAPAMNSAMWAKPAVQRNVVRLRDDGFHFVGPQEGWQSCRRTGIGRMAEPAEIEAAIERLLANKVNDETPKH